MERRNVLMVRTKHTVAELVSFNVLEAASAFLEQLYAMVGMIALMVAMNYRRLVPGRMIRIAKMLGPESAVNPAK
jgi:hypothetical protein